MYASIQCCRPGDRTYRTQSYDATSAALVVAAGDQRMVLDFHTTGQVDDAVAALFEVRALLAAK